MRTFLTRFLFAGKDAASPVSSDELTLRRGLSLLFFLIVAWIPVLIGRDTIQSAASLFPLAGSGNPYFHPEQAGLLYLWSPIVVISACIFFLSPGLFLSLALNAGRGIGEWVVSGLGLSIIVISSITGAAQAILNKPIQGDFFLATVVLCSIISLGFLLLRLSRGVQLNWPFGRPNATTTILSMIIVPMVILIALTPKFYWENFNGDGANAFEATRLLLYQPVPFWPVSAGDVASFPGITSMLFIYPASWFVRLFGEVEASMRLPFLLDLVALYGIIHALVENGRARLLGWVEGWLIWLALIIYTIVVAYSATYNQYSADIALPATQDTLMMVFFLAFILSFLKRQRLWMFFFIGLTYISLPSGVQLIGFWLLGVALIWKPRPWRQMFEVVIGILVCFLITAIAPYFLRLLHLPPPGNEYALGGLLRHFAWLQVTDWRRFLFFIIPSGILPAFSLFAYRKQSQAARTLIFVTVFYFFFFYFSAYTVLHYFIPAMLLPLVIFWQHPLVVDSKHKPFILSSVLVTGALALLLSLPYSASLDTSARLVGTAIEDRMGGYDTFDPAEFKRTDLLLYHLFPIDWDPKVPNVSYGGSSLAWNYYMHHTDGTPRKINYAIQLSSDPIPSGMRLVAQEGDASLYVLSDQVWADHLALRPPTPAGSKIYEIPRGLLFRSIPVKDSLAIIDVPQLLKSIGINIEFNLY